MPVALLSGYALSSLKTAVESKEWPTTQGRVVSYKLVRSEPNILKVGRWRSTSIRIARKILIAYPRIAPWLQQQGIPGEYIPLEKSIVKAGTACPIVVQW